MARSLCQGARGSPPELWNLLVLLKMHIVESILMAPQRKQDEVLHQHSQRKAKSLKKGFSVGPANLPDGTHRRKGTFLARK